ncbi:hypothetical protein F2Q68_00027699 [Brassica cretica]|uniref:LOB domain-containing protein n=1 Tax=Brassica cretica TaxID=69181 RepID=A0A8S9ICF9_BRACR|nr:hypothetical protein F2Q68_00027699 [Brassica cretica]
MVRVRVVMKKRMMVIVATKTSLGIQFQPTLDDPHLKKAKGPETVLDDRLANFTGFGLLDDSDEDEVPYSTVGSFEAVEKEPEIVFNDRSDDSITDMQSWIVYEEAESFRVYRFDKEVGESQRGDAANSLVYEANLRLRDPIYGCMGAISALQHHIQSLQSELTAVRTDILRHKYREAATITSLQNNNNNFNDTTTTSVSDHAALAAAILLPPPLPPPHPPRPPRLLSSQAAPPVSLPSPSMMVSSSSSSNSSAANSMYNSPPSSAAGCSNSLSSDNNVHYFD